MLVQTRNNWAWYDDAIWVFQIRAVGQYFSSVTGWPPMSVGVWLGVFYTFFPTDATTKYDRNGRLLPMEWSCQMRSHLSCTLDQKRYKVRLKAEPEKKRDDIWWIEPDGSNVDGAIENIRAVYLADGREWFNQMSDLSHALRIIEQERDCCNKFRRATYLARGLADKPKFERYRALWKAEALSKGLPYDAELDSEA